MPRRAEKAANDPDCGGVNRLYYRGYTQKGHAVLMMVPHLPVGLPGIAAFALGVTIFFITLLMARARGTKQARDNGGRRANSSMLWIILQGIGIGIAGFGPITFNFGPVTLDQLVSAAIVLALMISAVWLFDASSRTMGRNWALVARTRGDATLVTTGPFAYVRNPIYVALGLFMIAMAVAYGHVANLIVGMPIFLLGTWLRVMTEEKLLRAEFGAAYDAYAARVKRFVPGII